VPSKGGQVTTPRWEPSQAKQCVVTGDPRVLAPRARIRSGLEAVSWSDRLAIGYTVDPNHGVAMLLDPESLSPIATSEQGSAASIRHVAPTVSFDGKLGFAADIDSGNDRITKARTVTGPEPFLIGVARESLVWSESSEGTVHELWSIGPQPMSSLHVVSLGDSSGFAVAFRQGDTIRLGVLLGDKSPAGPLATVSAPGGVGEVALAASDGAAMVAWSSRGATASTASLAWARWVPGQQPMPAHVLHSSSSAEALAPSLAGIGGGSFLLAYTSREGWSSRVLGQAIDAAGEPLGAPIAVSTDHSGAGWASAAVTDDGRGVVAFLAPTGARFELMATPIACPVAPEKGIAKLTPR
jgi:hypothetical protein